jgi:PAS domain S-box-containing protein
MEESEVRFRQLFDEAPIGAAIVGLDLRFRITNDEFRRIFGYSSIELGGDP